MPFSLMSPSFTQGDAIPRRFTCEGEDVSPALRWSDVPGRTGSLALIVEDPDAPDPAAPLRIWVHWVVYDIPPSTDGLPEDAARQGLPAGCRQGRNDWGRPGYGGPCPPKGRHRYFFKLYALDRRLPDLGTPDKTALEAAMRGHVLAEAELMGTYEKAGAGRASRR